MVFIDVIVVPVRVNKAGSGSVFALVLLVVSNDKSSVSLLSILSFIFLITINCCF
ncbi:hypothetical protein [Chlamydia crocodili]|uniref:hypothetical protein n=1 Tax=Chlamydia TaxID=810 RepID=UPI003DA8D69C